MKNSNGRKSAETIIAGLIILLAAILLFPGCSSSPAPGTSPGASSKSDVTSQSSKRTLIRMEGGSAGGTMYFQNELIASAIRTNHPDWNVQVVAGPTPVTTYGMLLENNMEIATMEMTCFEDYRNAIIYGQKMPGALDMRWVIPHSVTYAHLLTADSTPITGFADWIGRKVPLGVMIGRVGTNPWYDSLVTLETYGVNQKQMEGWGCKFQNQGSEQMDRLIGDGVVSTIIWFTGYPHTQMMQMATTKKLKLFGTPEPEIIAKLEKRGMMKGIIPANSYPFQPNDVVSAKISKLQAVKATMDPDITYAMAKSAIENRDMLIKGFAGFAECVTDDAIREHYRLFGDWLHPGAKKYYLEKGIIK